MTVKLTSNFLQNARGLTFKDSASATWAINANTNELSCTTGGGTVGSVGLSDGSTAPIYAISNSPVTGSGTLTFTLKTQSANLVLAGPGSGSAAQPTFRALVVADIPSGYAYGNLTGTPSIPAGANPSATIGLAATNGSSTSFMRADGAPALNVAITPTWTGLHTWVSTPIYISNEVNPAVIINASGSDFGQITNVGASSWALGYGTSKTANGTAVLTWTTSGSVTISNTFAINGGTPTAALSGFGSPSGTVTSGLSSSSTLAQTAGTLAALLAYLKTIGFIAT